MYIRNSNMCAVKLAIYKQTNNDSVLWFTPLQLLTYICRFNPDIKQHVPGYIPYSKTTKDKAEFYINVAKLFAVDNISIIFSNFEGSPYILTGLV